MVVFIQAPSEVIRASNVDDFTVEEISNVINSSSSTVRVHLAQARLRLKEAIKKKYPEFIGGDSK